jgi:hypothetical protein
MLSIAQIGSFDENLLQDFYRIFEEFRQILK